MAPKRSGGSGSSGSGSSGISPSCPNAFQDVSYYTDPTPVVEFVRYCVVFVLTLVVLMSLWYITRRHRGVKKLAGPIYLLSLLCTLIAYALLIISTMLQECETTDYYSYYDWLIAYIIFNWIGYYLLLVVIVWSINSVLCERLKLDETGQKVIKIISSVILGFVGAITCSYIGLSCYNSWTYTPDGTESGAQSKSIEEVKLGVTCFASYLFSVIAAGALSIAIMVSRGFYRLLGWTIALILCMFISFLFPVIELSSFLQKTYFSKETNEAFYYISDLFWILSYIAVLILAKSQAWDRGNTGSESTP